MGATYGQSRAERTARRTRRQKELRGERRLIAAAAAAAVQAVASALAATVSLVPALLVADNKTGYFGVHHHPGKSKPYLTQVRRGGLQVSLGMFATAEEAALCIARSPVGQAAAQKAAAAPTPLTSEEEGKGSFVKEEGVVPPMPPDAYVKVEVVIKEESSGSRPKRRRTK